MLFNSLALTGNMGTVLGLGVLGGVLGGTFGSNSCNRCCNRNTCVRVPDFARRPPCLRCGCGRNCNCNCNCNSNIQPFGGNAGLFNTLDTRSLANAIALGRII